MAWRDYSSSANTNFAFEAFETEEKSSLQRPRETGMSNGHHHPSGAMTTMTDGPQLQHQQHNGHNGHNGHSQQMQQLRGAAALQGPRATYSLPRAPGPRHSGAGVAGPTQGYYTQDRRPRMASKPNHTGTLQPQPDFYFMPSQRKYSGEVVRVYVDYGNQKQK